MSGSALTLSVHRATVVTVTRERLITITEACTSFGKSRAQIYRWIAEHHIPEVDRIPGRGHSVGRPVYRLSDFAAAAAERHAERHANAPTEDTATKT